MSSYRCADGRLLYIFAIDHVQLPRELLEVVGLWPHLQAAGLTVRDPYMPAASVARNNLADSSRLSARWQRRLRRELARALLACPADEWESRLGEAGIPCAVQSTTQEWLHQSQWAQAGIVEVVTRDGSRIHQPGPAVWLRGQAGVAVEAPTVLAPAAPSVTTRPRLAGKLVLDLSSMVAGPVCGRTLGEYGARVIKIDSPHPRHGPRLTCWYGVDVKQGKQSLLLDLLQPAGRRVLDRLIARADVLLHNFTNDACDHLRLKLPEIQAVNPQIVVTRIGAFRGPKAGPHEGRKGYDPVLQAASGIMRRYGDDDHPVHHGIASCIDYLTGYLAAYAPALGLFAQRGVWTC